tara:strand:+ start:23541 stop:24425 length:885 start_codon:yes stop_codon:yes gene_type:complete
MSFDSKWSELSEDQRTAAKEQHGGSRSSWQDAKARSQGYKDRSDFETQRSASKTLEPSSQPSAATTNTSNSDALNNEHSPKANDVGAAAKPAVKAPNYDKPFHAAAPKGQAATPTKQLTSYERYVQERKDNAASHHASARHAKEMHTKFGSGDLGRDSTKDFYDGMAAKNARRTNESYKYDKVNDPHVKALMESGNDYNELEVLRSRNGGEYQDPSRDPHYGGDLYKAYGGGHEGYTNWKNNFSIYSRGGFQGVQDMMSTEDVQKSRDQRQSNIDAWKNSDEYKFKYGKYDWSR